MARRFPEVRCKPSRPGKRWMSARWLRPPANFPNPARSCLGRGRSPYPHPRFFARVVASDLAAGLALGAALERLIRVNPLSGSRVSDGINIGCTTRTVPGSRGLPIMIRSVPVCQSPSSKKVFRPMARSVKAMVVRPTKGTVME